MQRVIPITINIKTGTTDSQIMMYRGDNVKFQFNFTDTSSVSLDTATKLRVLVKPANDLKASYVWFSGEATITAEDYSIEFTSEQTSGYAGNGFLAVLVLDANNETVCTAGIPFRVEPSGYDGVYTPSENFRDEVYAARDAAVAAAATATNQANLASTSATAAFDSADLASTKASQASSDAIKSEGYATGTNNGQPVSNTSPYYENNSKYYSEQAKNSSIIAGNLTAQAAEYTSVAESQANIAKTQAELAATSAQTAQQAAAQATEISDPEGWRTATRGLITDLAASKVDVGTFHFGSAGGCLKNTTTSFGTMSARSMCITLKFDKDFSVADWGSSTSVNIIGDLGYAEGLYNGISLRMTSDGRFYLVGGKTTSGKVSLTALNYFPIFFGGASNQIIPAGIYAIVATVAVGETSTLSQIYVNGELKETYTATGLTTSLFNAGVGFDVCTVGNFHSTDFSNGCFRGGISRVAVFNFDMSAADSPYTVADYYNGKAIPAAMQSSLNITWNATDVPIYSTMAASVTSIPAGSVGYMSRPATIAYEDDGSISWTAKSAASGFPQALIYRFKRAAFGSGKLKVNIGALTSTLPSGTRFFVNYVNSSGIAASSIRKEIGTSGGSFEFDYKDGCMGIGIQLGTNTEWAVGNSLKVASVSVVVNGCIIASSDYAIARNATTKLVKDITGNGNDLTVYGDVVGDKDAAIAAFVDELKTQISQNS